MSGLINKVKDAVQSDESSTGTSGQQGTTGQGNVSGMERTGDNALNQQIDNASDRLGLGDKYDSTADKYADRELNKEIPGGQQ